MVGAGSSRALPSGWRSGRGGERLATGGADGLAARGLGWLLTYADWLAIALLVLAAASPQSAPTAAGLADPDSYESIWNARVGPANVFELGALGLAVLWLMARLTRPGERLRPSRLDAPVLALACALGALQLLALARGEPSPDFLAFDFEHVLVPLAGYLIVTRLIEEPRTLRLLGLLLAGAVLVRAAELVVVHGIFGDTGFGTGTGRTALLITEDSLLLALPLLLVWGAWVDGRLRELWGLVAPALLVAVVTVDLLSLRRGALVLLVAAVLLRSLRVRRAVALRGLLAAIAVAGLLFAAGPLREDARYVFTTLTFQREDPSTSQRDAELANFADNMRGLDWLTGNGLGTPWYAYQPAPVELGSFGEGESAYVRIGWHVFGLDYAYKFGLLGVALLLFAGVAFARTVRRGVRAAWEPAGGDEGAASSDAAPPAPAAAPPTGEHNSRLGGWLWSLGLCVPVFTLLALTNLRVGLMAGVCLGIVSRLLDLIGSDSEGPAQRPAEARS